MLFFRPSWTQKPSDFFRRRPPGSTSADPPSVCLRCSEEGPEENRGEKRSHSSFQFNSIKPAAQERVHFDITYPTEDLGSRETILFFFLFINSFSSYNTNGRKLSYFDSPEVTWQEEDDGDHGGDEAPAEMFTQQINQDTTDSEEEVEEWRHRVSTEGITINNIKN